MKQRLLGSAVLVALAVIFVPELLKGPPEPVAPAVSLDMPEPPPALDTGSGVTISLPPRGETPPAPSDMPADAGGPIGDAPESAQTAVGGFVPVPDAMPGPPATTKVGEAVPAPVAAEEAPVAAQEAAPPPVASDPPRSAPPEPPPAVVETPAPVARSAPQDTPAELDLPRLELISRARPDGSGTSGAGWGVQVGSFGLERNALIQRGELRDRGFPALVERTVGEDGRELFRVRVGPLPSREAGERTLERLRRAGTDGHVVELGR